MDDPDALVVVYETRQLLDAAMLRGALQDEDIPFTVDNEVMSSVYPVDGMAVMRFRVRAVDAERAREIVREIGLPE